MRLNILFVSQIPASPPRFGAQARTHGLMTNLARHHDMTAVMLVDEEFDIDECRRALEAYCKEVVLVPNPYGRAGFAKRLVQLRSLVSTLSFQRLRVLTEDPGPPPSPREPPPPTASAPLPRAVPALVVDSHTSD